ncbi:MAG: NAD(P)/FAD-dependent oxidoreductase [Proteobacteria bacterium]|nr:NAD(P)/FAD-dependent oxidoreductase [Pseudomonadota bacterium]
MKKYDAIVIGAGHNGLTNAAYLAKAGLDVLVVEKNPYIGGATVSRELHEGWKYSNCSYVCSLLRPEISRDLNLSKFGLQIIPYVGGVTFINDGGYFGSYDDHERQYREIARFSRRDANAYERYKADVTKQTRFIRPFLMRTPPDLSSFKPRDIRELLFYAKSFYNLGEKVLGDTLRFWTMSIGDFLDEYFETDVIKAHLAGSGIIGTALGVYSPGTAYVLLHHYMGEVDGTVGAWGFARGGMGSVAKAIAGAFQSFGGEIKTDAGVDKILVTGNKTKGVVLANGDEYYADIVVSNLDPKRTFLGLVGRGELSDDFRREIESIRMNGPAGKVNFVLSEEPRVNGMPAGRTKSQRSLFTLVPSLEEAEDNYNASRRGDIPRRLWVDCVLASNVDDTLAPAGRHMLTCFVQYLPYQLRAGSWDDQRENLGDRVTELIGQFAPNMPNSVIARRVMAPPDLEDTFAITEGNIFHGDISLDQMFFMRPIPEWSQYRTPIRGLWLCGAGTHPGGGVTGAPGYNAAHAILRAT